MTTTRPFKITFLLFCFLISLNILIPHAVFAETCESGDVCQKPPGSSDPEPSPEPSGQDPEPFPPGGDNPDETYAVDSGNPPLEPYFKSDPDAVVLQNGYYKSFGNLLSKLKKSGNNADLNTPPQDLLSAETAFVIPSGGLYGLENSAFFKASLDEYVKQGGTKEQVANLLPQEEPSSGSFIFSPPIYERGVRGINEKMRAIRGRGIIHSRID